jgi:hypothetical protein
VADQFFSVIVVAVVVAVVVVIVLRLEAPFALKSRFVF